jgi:hypothetical protein
MSLSYHLIVTAPFAGYERGSLITDPKVIATVEVDHHDRVVRIAPVAAVTGKE